MSIRPQAHFPIRRFFSPSSVRLLISFCALPALALLFAGCGGSGSGSVHTVSVSPTLATISVKNQQAFAALALDSSGNQVLGQTFTWTSSDTSVATIAGSGVATGVGPGTTMISASTGSVSSQPVTLNVTPVIASVTLSPASATIKVGATQQFTATAIDVSGNVVTATFTWQNSSAKIATIDANGLVTGLSPGTIMITATASGITSPVATLTVTP